jgi:dTDP-glucose pyrophosphorylase
MCDTVVIMARGLGTRMRKTDAAASLTPDQAAVAATGLKAMIPIDRPFLDYVLHDLIQIGFSRVVLVIGPEHDQVRRYYREEHPPRRLHVEFAVQAEPRGTADAVAAARDYVGDALFLVLNSDNYYPPVALSALRTATGPAVVAFDQDSMVAGSNIEPERIGKFAVVDSTSAGELQRIIEKPSPEVLAALRRPVGVSMNCWRFDHTIFAACQRVQPSVRGELELTDAVQVAIDELGVRFRVIHCKAPVLDLSSRADVAAVTERLRGREVSL